MGIIYIGVMSLRGRWNRETWHHGTWRHGTRSNRYVKARLNRGGPEQRRTRRAENEDMPLRQIFGDVCHTLSATGKHFSFANMEAATYKRRRCAQLLRQMSSTKADSSVSSRRYIQLEHSNFCRGVADAGGNRSELILTTNAQLELLWLATQLYFEATLKMVPTI